MESVDVRQVVEAALDTVRPSADAKNIRLQTALASGGTVMGDPQRLQQVIWNLLSNAVKFTPKGGRVQVLIELRDSSVEVTVSDTGPGVAHAFQPYVFERFRQQEGGTTRSYGGLGLGLSIVRQLVELHGGSASLFSEGEGRGASFTVVLPLALTKRGETTPLPELQKQMSDSGLHCPPELEGLDIIVIDDELDAREMLRTMLETCGARVRLAASAAEGLLLLERRCPSVLISDIGMPEVDGYALIQHVRRLPAALGGKVPAVALTAYARTEDRTRTLLSGYNHHVTKPIEPLELLAVVASLASHHQQRS